MYGVVKQELKHLSVDEYLMLKELCHLTKNMYNVGLYNIRQYFFKTNKYLNYYENYKISKENENYSLLNSNVAQQILKKVSADFESFFSLLKKKNNGEYKEKVKIPRYKDKDGYFNFVIQQVQIKDNSLLIPLSNLFRKTKKKENSSFENLKVKIPKVLIGKQIKEVIIIPRHNAKFFEIHYTYVKDNEEINNISKVEEKNKKLLAIDVGITNLCTCVTNTGDSFIIDGKKLKSYNRLYNKINAQLQSIKDKQGIIQLTKRQQLNLDKRNKRVDDYIIKACKYIINYCIDNEINTLIIGYNKGMKKNSNMNHKNNQNSLQIPTSKIKYKLKYLCEEYNIEFIEQEESYTSKASFFDNDYIPIYGVKPTNIDNKNIVKDDNKILDETDELGEYIQYKFSGRRIKRGLYKTKQGKIINADVNGALNIMKKCKWENSLLTALLIRGAVSTPRRISIWQDKLVKKKKDTFISSN